MPGMFEAAVSIRPTIEDAAYARNRCGARSVTNERRSPTVTLRVLDAHDVRTC